MSNLPAVTSSSPIAVGQKFYNKYSLLNFLGRGSFGQVWLALDQALNCNFAIKILDSGVTIDQRLREAQVGHAFSHVNLMKVHQADVAIDDKVVIAMDYYSNGSILSLCNSAGFIALPNTLDLIKDVLQGLEHLHVHNCFHNDIKPENILVNDHNRGVLTDYGIVGISPDGNPVVPSQIYVLHAAPEVVQGGGIEVRTDIFQTGLTLFRMLVGVGELRSKFQSLGQESYNQAINSGNLITKKDFPAFVPHAVRRLVLKAIDPDPTLRFQSALAMRRELEAVSFVGHWSTDDHGTLRGYGRTYEYRYEFQQLDATKFDFTGYKKHKISGREVRVGAFTKSNLSRIQMKKIKDKFIQDVVCGRI